MSDTAHQEKHLESYIVSKLEKQGWKVGKTEHYDTERALYADDLISWLEATQPEKLEKLKKDNGDRFRDVLMDRLAKALETHGAVQLRDHSS
jgi:type I restriction enzyme R subunit